MQILIKVPTVHITPINNQSNQIQSLNSQTQLSPCVGILGNYMIVEDGMSISVISVVHCQTGKQLN